MRVSHGWGCLWGQRAQLGRSDPGTRSFHYGPNSPWETRVGTLCRQKNGKRNVSRSAPSRCGDTQGTAALQRGAGGDHACLSARARNVPRPLPFLHLEWTLCLRLFASQDAAEEPPPHRQGGCLPTFGTANRALANQANWLMANINYHVAH